MRNKRFLPRGNVDRSRSAGPSALRGRAHPPEATRGARGEYYAKLEDAANANLWPALEEFRIGDYSSVEILIEFLERDPYFFRSGYIKERILDKIRPDQLSSSGIDRLRQVCLHAVDVCGRREFRRYCRLAARIGDVKMLTELQARCLVENKSVRRRARWMLFAIAESPLPFGTHASGERMP